MLAGLAVACLSSYHQASTISFKTNSSAQCTGQVLKKSLEDLVIKLRNYNLDMGSGAGTGIPRFPRFRFRQFDLLWFIILSYFPPLHYY